MRKSDFLRNAHELHFSAQCNYALSEYEKFVEKYKDYDEDYQIPKVPVISLFMEDFEQLKIKCEKVINICFRNTAFSYTVFEKCSFSNVEFNSCDLNNTLFIDCTFDEVTFYADIMYKASFNNCTFNTCVFKYMSALNCEFRHCEFNNAQCESLLAKDTYICGSYVKNSCFSESVFKYCTIIRGDISKCKFKCCTFSQLNSENVNSGDIYDNTFVECIGASVGIPQGELIVFKALEGSLIAKLKLFEHSKRSRAFSDKCRTDECLVLDIYERDTKRKHDCGNSGMYVSNPIEYKVGSIVKVDDFTPNRFEECSKGIHFFLTEEKAIEYSKVYAI